MHSSFARLFSTIAVTTGLLRVQAATYSQSTSYIGQDFLNGAFDFFTDPDPTEGRVTYVNQATATAQNLTFATDDVFILRADDKTVLTASDPGRNSVRLTSAATFGSPSAMVLDLAHMPEGCGTWPAFWTFGPNWPLEGEIDIMEGVNNQNANQGTLHTGPSCTMPASRTMTGTVLNNDCDADDDGNEGCGVQFAANTFGPSFNSQGGGWFAMERTDTFISIWFWARGSTSVPSDVKNGNSNVDTSNWGTPVAFFPNTDCDIASEFQAHNIVINCRVFPRWSFINADANTSTKVTFCGVFAGQTSIWDLSCAASTGVAACNDYVNANPSAFTNAYFEINSVRVYQ
ncbi:glycoside hydrolase family 16 protein [Collybiopsis luxurians FD-317 M1]|uniref:Unplaced genomic scaffold GYMLUscaffold_35, whole genome shotgun sequence n=1 Tax=Collybiopsis luxurians FD-317 M1 TaxID=944289 RepID=A0A0D0C8D8_9AGAR|nr:glycoside hydrolase family 16 protein [Collybiopsis luxurians FD-317 M1]